MKLNIKVQPNSFRQEIQTSIDGGVSKVFLKKPAKNNKANNELIKFLKKHFKREVKIIKGFNSKKKTIEIKNGYKISSSPRYSANC